MIKGRNFFLKVLILSIWKGKLRTQNTKLQCYLESISPVYIFWVMIIFVIFKILK